MRHLALSLTLALALAAPALSLAAEEPLPPPPPPPETEQLPPPPFDDRIPARRPPSTYPPAANPDRIRAAAPGHVWKPGTIGEGALAPAGSPAAPLHPDETVSHWRYSLASGVVGRFGGKQIDQDRENSTVMLYFGGQADGLWTEGYGQAARLRFRVMAGGEREVFLPSDGEVEAAYMIGRREFRFVIGRLEVGRYPGLAVQALVQAATLPSFEGSVSLAADTMRLYYYVSPVEMAYVAYYDDAHIKRSDPVKSETDEPAAATAARLRYTVLLPPSVTLSLQGDVLKMWKKPDALLSAEGSLGYQVLEQSVAFNVAIRWNSYARRRATGENSSRSESELQLVGTATLVF